MAKRCNRRLKGDVLNYDIKMLHEKMMARQCTHRAPFKLSVEQAIAWEK